MPGTIDQKNSESARMVKAYNKPIVSTPALYFKSRIPWRASPKGDGKARYC